MVWQTIGAIATGASAIGSFFGQNKKYKQDKAFQDKLFNEYTLPGYEMDNKKLIADHKFLVKSIELQKKNAIALAEFKDKNNLRNWHQKLKINSFVHREKMKEFNKSEHLFHRSVKDATQQKKIRDEETYAQFAYQNEDRIIESIKRKSDLAATSQTGASAISEMQSVIAEGGREQTILKRNLLSANRESRMQFKDFLRQADANRMIRPTKAPDPLKPLKTLVPEFQMPRPLEEFDFGPKPIKGIPSTSKPSLFTAGLGAVAGFAGSVGDANVGADLKTIGGWFI